jgi:hypothetical protein
LGTLNFYQGAKKIRSITTHLADSNDSIGKAIGNLTGGYFHAEEDLLGCVAQDLNLVAKDGLAVFGSVDENANGHDQNLDGTNINLASIYQRVLGLARYTCATPERRKEFKESINLFSSPNNINNPETSYLILDVRNRWNSTFFMFERALLLQLVNYLD